MQLKAALTLFFAALALANPVAEEQTQQAEQQTQETQATQDYRGGGGWGGGGYGYGGGHGHGGGYGHGGGGRCGWDYQRCTEVRMPLEVVPRSVGSDIFSYSAVATIATTGTAATV